MSLLTNILIGAEMTLVKNTLWKSFLSSTKNPKETQWRVLKSILQENKDTVFGKEHKFQSIKDYESFCREVPVSEYEDLEKYIHNQEQLKKPYLTHEQPVLYARTSGTTSEPKLLPISRSAVERYKRSQKIATYVQYSRYPSMLSGYILAIGSPAVEGHLPSGTPYGSMSGLIYEEMSWLVRSKFVVPAKVFDIKDYELKYIIIAAFSLLQKNITAMVSANPSTFIKLLDVINTNQQKIIYIIKTGSFDQLKSLTEGERKDLEKHFEKNSARAQELEELFAKHHRLTYAHIWSHLITVSTWTAGSCNVLIPVLKENLSENTHILEIGYLASEFRGSITVDVENNRSVPTLHETFFEFVEKDDWENVTYTFRTLDILEEGRQYYIFITTDTGLYRYHMNDIIEVTGFFNKTPVIRFVQKGKGVTNLTGEKLYEGQILKVLEQLEKEKLIEPVFFIALADEKELEYTLYLEDTKGSSDAEIANLIDKNLAAVNIEYEAKRKSGRLKPLKIVFLKRGTGDSYKKEALGRGARENQFKVLPLQYKRDFTFDIEKYAL